MKEAVTLTGMVLVASPVKEYDRRMELLTRERGRISAFAQGARKAGSALSACTVPLTYGEFTLYEGRNSYTLRSASIQKYFGDIAEDYDKTCYASYFAEMARYFCRENIDASGELLLLYITLSAMQQDKMPLKLIRIVYEMRIMQMQGQGIELFECLECHRTDSRQVYFQAGGLLCPDCARKNQDFKQVHPYELSKDALYSLQFILSAPLSKLYSFLVTEEILRELIHFMQAYKRRFLQHSFKSEGFLE